MRNSSVVALLLAAGIGGCGGGGGTAGESGESGSDEHRLLRDAAEVPLERARAVEDLAAGRRGDLDEAVEDAGDQ